MRVVANAKTNVLGLLMVLALAGCNPAGATPVSELPAFTETQSAGASPGAQSPASTPGAPALPTMTLLPSLPAEEAEAKLLALLQDNGGCQLPCFWGFTPGETGKEQARSALNEFHGLGSDSGLVLVHQGVSTAVSISFDEEPAGAIRWMRVDLTARQGAGAAGLPVYGHSDYGRDFRYYTLSGILAAYGPPENVYIGFENLRSGYEHYLYLDYTRSGWVALLTMPLRWRGNFDILVGCPNEAFTTLWLWSPNDLEMARRFGFLDYQGPLKSFEEASALTIAAFSRRFGNAEDNECLETPSINLAP